MALAHYKFLVACVSALLVLSSSISAEIVEQTFYVQNFAVQRLCKQQVITAVNGALPGPTIVVEEGDTIIIHIFNKSPYNITVHWHGVFQRSTQWADGPEYVTQCPIRPGNSYTYKFNIIGQVGTLWWHAHSSWLRATVHGALIIKPRDSYPFPTPYMEYPILLGEWWNANVVDIINQALATGAPPRNSDAYTINGLPGDLYSCSQNQTNSIKLAQGKTYLLRIINVALNSQLFFSIASHKMTVVAVDASYTKPYLTDVVLVAPGQTTDVLLTADQAPGSYYTAATPYNSAPGTFNNSTTRGIVVYEGSTPMSTPPMPTLPAAGDTTTAFRLNSALIGLVNEPHWAPVPTPVDVPMFVTVGLGVLPCGGSGTCLGPLGQRTAASMNNVSLQLPSKLSMLEAFFNGVSGIYDADFPDNPPVTFDYTNSKFSLDTSLVFTKTSTSVKILKYNAVVEMVLQNTALVNTENHPMHIHGFNFHVLAQGFGNYYPATDKANFNLINPQIRNTIGVPVGGWAVIRFQVNNPGVWFMHCHMDEHLPIGLGMVFVVENGPTDKVPPPPADLPRC